MNILEYIENIPHERVAFITKDEKVLYSDIKKIFITNKPVIETLQNTCVAINARSRFEFAKLLSILDGKVKRIVFLPEDLDKNLVDKYYKESTVNYEVYLENNLLQLNTIGKNTNKILESITNTQWVIPTSGTTNNPKLVAHTLASLSKTAKKNIEQGYNYTWGLTFDIYRFSGIQVFLQALFGGSSIIIPESNDSMNDIIDLFVKNSCNILSATPSFWRKILMTKESKALNIKRATLGGEIADQSILKALKNTFNDIKITHIYASTEVGVGFAVTDGLAGFPYSYVEHGLDNIQIKIDEASLLWINPKNKEQDYIANNSIYDNDGFINTGDLVKIENNRVFFLGRASGSINVGGNKVQPEEVEAKLLASNLLSNAFVYSKKNPIMGSLVCADVVAIDKNQNKNELKKQLLSYCRENLENFKIPAILKIVDDLEITQSGKIKRN